MAVLPHVASIGNGPNAQEELTFPLNPNNEIIYAIPPLSKLRSDACGIAYDEGLLYCSSKIGECIYHKLGTGDWTQPSVMQPGFITQEPGYAIIGGKLWMSGGSPTLGNILPFLLIQLSAKKVIF